MQIGNDLVLVTGATGKQGGAVARQLLAKGHRIRIMTRRPDSPAAQELGRLGALVVAGDLDDVASLEPVVKGAWGVFAVQTTWEAGVEGEEEQGKRLAKIAREMGVRHFVYTSVQSADRKTGIPHFENKYRVEETVRGLGFPSHVILRPVFFMDNFVSPWFLPGIQQGQLVMGMRPETVLQMIAVTDIGKHGARAFERHEELNRRVIDIAGDQHTMPETARILGETAHKRIEFVKAPIEEVRKMSADYAAMLEWFDRVGYDVDIERLAKESDIRATRLGEWAREQQWVATGAAP